MRRAGKELRHERRRAMQRVIRLHIERLPEGVYLATSEDVQGLVVQGRTIWETMEIARDVARKLLEALQAEMEEEGEGLASLDVPLVVEG